MLVLRLLVMVLTIICLMDGHAEVSSSSTGMRNGGESPAVKQNEPKVQILDRKKKKKPKPGKKKKPKPGKNKKPKPNKAKPTTTKPVTTTPTMTTSTLKTTTILTTPPITTTATTTTPTVSPTTTATTAKITTSTASATTTLLTTTSATTTVETSSTASTTTSTIPTTATTSSQPTTAATTADSGAGGECKATNGKPCIFPFKDGKEEYNECKNHGGTYFWCATGVYDSGKYKHWSYCSEDGPCPLEGDGECRATNNKPCVFPFKDGKKEYNECADHGGKYFWCATGTNSAGKYTAWSKCPKDGSCPLPQKSTTPAMTSTATAASTTPVTIGTTAATEQMEEKVLDTLENLVLGESRDDSLQMVHMLDKKLDTIIKDLEGETSKTGKLNQTVKHGQVDKVRDGTELGEGLMFVLSTVVSMKSVGRLSGDCCQDCTSKYPDTELAEYWETLDTCYCYKKFKNPDVEPKTRASSKFSTKACATGPTTEDKCCETLTLSSSGGAAQHQGHRLGTYKKDGEHSNMPVYKQQQGTNVLHYFRESNQFRWSFASSVSSGGGLSSKLGDASVCPSDVKIWQYYWPGTTNLWLVDSSVAVDCEEDLCGVNKKLDPERLIAEENSAYIFKFLDNSKDVTASYQTRVHDIASLDNSGNPVILNDLKKSFLPEFGLYTFFLAPGDSQCNLRTFEDIERKEFSYFTIFVDVFNKFKNIEKTKVFKLFIENKLNIDSNILEEYFEGVSPKLCMTLQKMTNETAHARKKTLQGLFNFFLENENNRNRNIHLKKPCKTKDDTLQIIQQVFNQEASQIELINSNVQSSILNGYSLITIQREQAGPKSILFVGTRFISIDVSIDLADEDDLVPYNGPIIFFTDSLLASVLIDIKQDDDERSECFTLEFKHLQKARPFFTDLSVSVPIPSSQNTFQEQLYHQWILSLQNNLINQEPNVQRLVLNDFSSKVNIIEDTHLGTSDEMMVQLQSGNSAEINNYFSKIIDYIVETLKKKSVIIIKFGPSLEKLHEIMVFRSGFHTIHQSGNVDVVQGFQNKFIAKWGRTNMEIQIFRQSLVDITNYSHPPKNENDLNAMEIVAAATQKKISALKYICGDYIMDDELGGGYWNDEFEKNWILLPTVSSFTPQVPFPKPSECIKMAAQSPNNPVATTHILENNNNWYAEDASVSLNDWHESVQTRLISLQKSSDKFITLLALPIKCGTSLTQWLFSQCRPSCGIFAEFITYTLQTNVNDAFILQEIRNKDIYYRDDYTINPDDTDEDLLYNEEAQNILRLRLVFDALSNKKIVIMQLGKRNRFHFIVAYPIEQKIWVIQSYQNEFHAENGCTGLPLNTFMRALQNLLSTKNKEEKVEALGRICGPKVVEIKQSTDPEMLENLWHFMEIFIHTPRSLIPRLEEARILVLAKLKEDGKLDFWNQIELMCTANELL